MPAYLVSEVVSVTDPAGFDEYRRRVAASVETFGGRYIVRSREVERLEGDWRPETIVIIEFESTARARAWWDSDEYRDIKKIRQSTAMANLIIVEGV